ncbi:hypothetical protein BTUL_0071g00430 [Botrytis tulipae]|uniref:Uncharacterized protein n=1 Tax=Botrytis tulipae TaxID=87230 RepID=A0A4Z1EM20_9HELO|nr:hypothetical protein BTUL_0071g00430 [Botrytis tulipae]
MMNISREDVVAMRDMSYTKKLKLLGSPVLSIKVGRLMPAQATFAVPSKLLQYYCTGAPDTGEESQSIVMDHVWPIVMSTFLNNLLTGNFVPQREDYINNLKGPMGYMQGMVPALQPETDFQLITAVCSLGYMLGVKGDGMDFAIQKYLKPLIYSQSARDNIISTAGVETLFKLTRSSSTAIQGIDIEEFKLLIIRSLAPQLASIMLSKSATQRGLARRKPEIFKFQTLYDTIPEFKAMMDVACQEILFMQVVVGKDIWSRDLINGNKFCVFRN